MTQYAGLCVGGPLAGKSISYPRQVMEVDVRPPLPVLGAGEAMRVLPFDDVTVARECAA